MTYEGLKGHRRDLGKVYFPEPHGPLINRRLVPTPPATDPRPSVDNVVKAFASCQVRLLSNKGRAAQAQRGA